MTTQTPVHYRVRCTDPHAHVFTIDCTVRHPAADGQRFTLPTWVPGSYLIREFARHFVTVTAHSNGVPVAIDKEAKDAWRAAPCAGPLTVTAEVYAYDLSVRTAYLDAARAYFNGVCLFLAPEGMAQAPCQVELVPPTHPGAAAWRVATTLPRDGASAALPPLPGDFGHFGAANYDELIDHPVEMGTFTTTQFEAGGVAHVLALSGDSRANLARIGADLQRICQAQCDLFGGHAPFPHYLFLTLALPSGRGGLEHRASTSMITPRDTLPSAHDETMSDGYVDFLGLASHEYFHSWNVKRIKPAAFTPYDLAHENYTRQLWAFEGITSYYDDLMLARSAVITMDQYVELLGRTITGVLRVPGRATQSLAASSFDAWIKYYRQDENTPNAVTSYYAKGAVVALALDLTLRRHGTSLDALMRALWERHGAVGVGVPEDGIARLVSELAGADMADFFARYVDGVEDPPLADLLADVGMAFQVRAAEGARDRGGLPGKAGRVRRTSLGAAWSATADLRLMHVLRGGAASRAGLSAHDVLVAVDGIRATAERLEHVLVHTQPGDTLTITAFRNDALMQCSVMLDPLPLDTAYISPAADAPAAALARRQAWLFG